jgi:hypothetical protein
MSCNTSSNAATATHANATGDNSANIAAGQSGDASGNNSFNAPHMEPSRNIGRHCSCAYAAAKPVAGQEPT